MSFQIGPNCQIDPSVIINVKDGFIGANSIIKAGARIEGTRVEIGREAYIDCGAVIGGGSCFDPDAYLKAGDWLHMGLHSQINIACGVQIGHEFGCGIETKIFTHGAYIDSYSLGAPVQWGPVTIGNNVWMPNAWVNPGVSIGDNIIIAARSLVNKNIDSGSFAGGVPAKIIQANYLPRQLSLKEKEDHIHQIIIRAVKRFETDKQTKVGEFAYLQFQNDQLVVSQNQKKTQFDLLQKTIEGNELELSHYVKDQLRRNGIRFRFEFKDHQWKPW